MKEHKEPKSANAGLHSGQVPEYVSKPDHFLNPIEAAKLRKRLMEDLTYYWEDNTNAWELHADGSYRQVEPHGGRVVAAQFIAMSTIGLADGLGLPVSTTHVLSSGVAGTMVANHSGLEYKTLRDLALAWILTFPAAMLIAGVLFLLFRLLVP